MVLMEFGSEFHHSNLSSLNFVLFEFLKLEFFVVEFWGSEFYCSKLNNLNFQTLNFYIEILEFKNNKFGYV